MLNPESLIVLLNLRRQVLKEIIIETEEAFEECQLMLSKRLREPK